MEFLSLLLVIVVLVPFVLPIVSWVSARRTRSRVEALEEAVAEQSRLLETLKIQLAQLRRETRTATPAEAAAAPPAPAEARPAAVQPPPAIGAPPPTPSAPPPRVPTAPPPAPPIASPPKPPTPRPVHPAAPPPTSAGVAPERPVVPSPSSLPVAAGARTVVTPPPPPPVHPSTEPQPSGASEPPFDWESLIGVKLFSAIAGVALVLAAVFFLRYSIEHGWLQPPVRVLIGIAAAVALLVACEMKAARKYPVTANALDAAAVAILFATFFAAHALWNLIPGSVAFVLLGVVTALAVLLSIRRESLFIAILGLLGGFATPVLLSTGENRPISLFSYLLLLNIGLAWVAYRNTWPVLTALTLVFTTIYQWGWVFRFLQDASDLPLAMGIFLVFPLVTFAGVLIARRPAEVATRTGADTAFEQTALLSAIVPLAFGLFLAAVPAYGARAPLLFGFLLLIDGGLLAVAIARRQAFVFAVAALTTLVVTATWLGVSYVAESRHLILASTAAFVLLFLLAESAARWFGRSLDASSRVVRTAAPVLLFVFPALAYLEPAFSSPWPLFGVLLMLLLTCAIAAVRTRDGYLYYIAAFFAVAAQAVWSVQHLTADTLGRAVAIYIVFGITAIAVPLLARRTRRALQPAGGAGLVLLASLALLLYLSTGPLTPTTLWALALLLAILNAGLFVESAGTRLPATSIAASVLSWVILAIWWLRAAGAVGVLPSLTVLVGLTLLTLAGHAWCHVSSEGGSAVAEEQSSSGLITSGLFLGLVGHLFLLLLSLNREWSIPPWPIFGCLTVVTVGATAAALFARTVMLHTAAVTGAAAVVLAWTGAATAAPWPTTALIAAAAVSTYAIVSSKWFGAPAAVEMAVRGAAAALFIGEFTAIAAIQSSGRPSIGAVILAHVANLSALLTITWFRQWRHVAVAVAFPVWVAVFGWRGPWHEVLALATALYITVIAYPLVLGRRAGAHRDPYVAAVVVSAIVFFSAHSALQAGGYGSIVGIVPVIEAAVLAVLLRNLLQMEAAGRRDLGRLALIAGAALAFITVAIPVQLEHQWITIGWALEGAALAWLYGRVPHKGLLYLSVALLATVFVRLALNPEIFRYEPRGQLRILNWYLYTYTLAAVASFAAAWWLSRTNDRIIGDPLRPSRLLPGAAVILLFLLLNIEIADFYATGPEIMFRFGAGVSQDLTYTIGWLVFGMLLLAGGIYLRSRPARVTAVALIAVTAFKCFLYDLGSLGGLYRVGSFVGLGISLALVSLALQKYVLARPKEAR